MKMNMADFFWIGLGCFLGNVLLTQLGDAPVAGAIWAAFVWPFIYLLWIR